MSKNKLEKIGERVFVSKLSGIVLQFSSRRKAFDAGVVNQVKIGNNTADVMYNGRNNNLPQERELLIQKNAYLPNLQIVQRNLLLGDEFIAFKKVRENGVTRIEEVDFPTKLTDKFPLDFIKQTNEELANDLVKHLAAYAQFVWKKDNTIVEEGIKVQKCTHIRAEKQNDAGDIENWWYSNCWAKTSDDNKVKAVLTAIKAYDRSLVRDVKNRTKWKQKSFLFPIRDMLLSDGYYPIPPVDGVRDAVELGNAVWIFHEANLKNGYNMRWHIEIPEDYFYDYISVESGKTTEEEEGKKAVKAEQDFMDKMNGFLAGMDNAGRAIYTKKLMKSLDKEYPGISIKALDYDMKDEALLKLEERAMTATLSNQGVPPILASVQLPSGFGSGSEIRNVLFMYQIIQMPFMRQKLFSWLEVLKMTEGLPSDVYFGTKDREITKLDANPTGSHKINISN